MGKQRALPAAQPPPSCVCLLALAGCGGGERQDENEPSGNFPVEVVKASFPGKQKLAKSSDLVVTVRNAGQETIPNIARDRERLRRAQVEPGPGRRDRPVFAINGVQVKIARLPGVEGRRAARLRHRVRQHLGVRPAEAEPDEDVPLAVTAVHAGDYKVAWRVAAGLDGKAKAVAQGGGPAPRGISPARSRTRRQRARGRRRPHDRQRDSLSPSRS